MKLANRRAAATLCLVAVLALPSAGCEGDGDSRPRVMLDDAGPEGGDAGPAGDDAGLAGDDAGSSAADAGSTGGDAGAPADPECGDPVEQEQLRVTNAERTGAGLAPLVCDPALTRAARLHSQDMCDQRYFDHDSLDGRTFRDRIDAQGVRWRRIGENIARGQPTPAAVHEAWMGSSGHRANIMSRDFGRIGIGHVACGGQGPYWTQDFAD